MRRIFNSGLTIIELLVVISIMAILSAIGLATYINFNRTQILAQTTKRLVQEIRLTASLAANNQKPISCVDDPLEFYAFVVTDLHSYKITYKCGGNEPDFKPEESVLPNIKLSPVPWSARFLVMRQGVIFPGEDDTNNTLTLTGFDKTRTIIVSKAGDISIDE